MAKATYLLAADEVDMARWRGQAGHAGVSFAAWIRGRLNETGPAVPPANESDVTPSVPGAAPDRGASGGASLKTGAAAGGVEGSRAASPRLRRAVQTPAENGDTGQEVGLTAAAPVRRPKRAKRARTEMCEHRIKPDSFCKACDG